MSRKKWEVIGLTLILSVVGLWVYSLLGMGKKMGDYGAAIAYPLVAVIISFLLALLCVRYVLPVFATRLSRILLFQPFEEYEANSHIDRALSHQAKGDYELAIEEFENAIKSERTDERTWLTMADILTNKLNDPEEAVATLMRGLEDQDWPMQAHMELLKALAETYQHKLENKESAESIYQVILKKYSDIPFCKTYAEKGLKSLNEA